MGFLFGSHRLVTASVVKMSAHVRKEAQLPLTSRPLSAAQIQVVDEASGTTSPDIPESGLAKMLKQKGECVF